MTAPLRLAGPPLQIEERYIVPGTGVALKAFTALSISTDRRFRYPVSCFARILFYLHGDRIDSFNLAVVSKALTCAAKQASSSEGCLLH
jgi:hypothetical protein